MTEYTHRNLPLLDPDTGRFPDDYSPPSVAEDRARAETAAASAEAAKEDVEQTANGMPQAVEDEVDSQVAAKVDPKVTRAETAATNAEASKTAAEQIATNMPQDVSDEVDSQVTAKVDPKVTQANAAATRAETAETAAAGSASSAGTYAGQADAHRAAALTAANNSQSSAEASGAQATAAETARTGAETAAGVASGHSDDASGFASQANTQRISAETARTGAETARTGSETARTGAETARDETIVEVSPLADWSGTVTLTLEDIRSKYLHRRFTGNVTLVLPDLVELLAWSVQIKCYQDGTGGRSLTILDTSASYSVPIALSTAANDTDLIGIEHDGYDFDVFLRAAKLGVPSSWVGV